MSRMRTVNEVGQIHQRAFWYDHREADCYISTYIRDLTASGSLSVGILHRLIANSIKWDSMWIGAIAQLRRVTNSVLQGRYGIGDAICPVGTLMLKPAAKLKR